jgi:hypothetical protein
MIIFVLLLYSGYASGKGGREVPLLDDPAVIEVRDQDRDDDQAEQIIDQRGPQYRGQQSGVDRVADEPVGA